MYIASYHVICIFIKMYSREEAEEKVEAIEEEIEEVKEEEVEFMI